MIKNKTLKISKSAIKNHLKGLPAKTIPTVNRVNLIAEYLVNHLMNHLYGFGLDIKLSYPKRFCVKLDILCYKGEIDTAEFKEIEDYMNKFINHYRPYISLESFSYHEFMIIDTQYIQMFAVPDYMAEFSSLYSKEKLEEMESYAA